MAAQKQASNSIHEDRLLVPALTCLEKGGKIKFTKWRAGGLLKPSRTGTIKYPKEIFRKEMTPQKYCIQ